MKNAHRQMLERGGFIVPRMRNTARQCFTTAVALAVVLSLMLVGPTTLSQDRPQPPNHAISLTITRVKQIDNVDDTRGGELYAKVTMYQQSFPKTGHREDRRDVSPNWTFMTVAPENVTFWIIIDIYDEDWPDPDDHCDVNPLRHWKTLKLRYNVATGRFGDDENGMSAGVSGTSGELIHVRGAGDGDRVEIWFRILKT